MICLSVEMGLKSTILIILAFVGFCTIAAQKEIDTIPLKENSVVEIDSIVDETLIAVHDVDTLSMPEEVFLPDYLPWERVTLQGKLKMQGLPLSPSVKIFMLRDSLISISIRAPFVGEAARIEINQDSITAVNKMNKTFVSERVSEFLKYYPGGISNVQDLLLDRFFLPGQNLEEAEIEDLIDIYFEDDQYNVIPKGEAEIEGIKYGFVVDEAFNPLMIIILPESRPGLEISAVYNRKLQGYDLQFIYQEDNKKMEFTLEMKEPDWDGETPKPLNLDKKYKKLTLGEFVSSF